MTDINLNQGSNNTVGGNNPFLSDNPKNAPPNSTPSINNSPLADQLTQMNELPKEAGLQNKNSVFTNPTLQDLPSENNPNIAKQKEAAGLATNFPVNVGYSDMTYNDFLRIIAEVLLAMRIQMAKDGKVPDAIDLKYFSGIVETWLGAKMPLFALHPRIFGLATAKNELENIKDKMQKGEPISLTNYPKLVQQLNQLGITLPSDNGILSNEDLKQLLTNVNQALYKEIREVQKDIPIEEILNFDQQDSLQQMPAHGITKDASKNLMEAMKPAEVLLNKLINGDVAEIIKSSNLTPSEQKIFQELVRGALTVIIFDQALGTRGKLSGEEKKGKDPSSLINHETLEHLLKNIDPQTEDTEKLIKLLQQLLKRKKIIDELLVTGFKVAEELGMSKETSQKVIFNNLSI